MSGLPCWPEFSPHNTGTFILVPSCANTTNSSRSHVYADPLDALVGCPIVNFSKSILKMVGHGLTPGNVYNGSGFKRFRLSYRIWQTSRLTFTLYVHVSWNSSGLWKYDVLKPEYAPHELGVTWKQMRNTIDKFLGATLVYVRGFTEKLDTRGLCGRGEVKPIYELKKWRMFNEKIFGFFIHKLRSLSLYIWTCVHEIPTWIKRIVFGYFQMTGNER